jgi:gamma-glutamyltranspeptidase/glutathione hydrolase
MRGAIAAGHPLTAQAGADVLRAGGNAVDAAIAAGFVSWVAESPLTGPGGGGFMLVHTARDGRTRFFDFFVAVPSGRLGEMEKVDVDFTDSTQVFKIGPASCAVPGAVLGMETAHRSHGRLPWRELAAPAAQLARRGLELTRPQAYLHAILDVIIRNEPEGRRVYRGLAAGKRFRLPDLAGTIEHIGEKGSRDLYRGELAREITRHGGAVTLRDLREYRVVRRRPVHARFAGLDFRLNPPPSTGGVLIGYGLALLERSGVGGPPGSAGAIARMVEVMREQNRARDEHVLRGLRRGGLTRRLHGTESLERAWARLMEGAGGTTHISVVDGDGNAAALSVSTGSGSGVFLPGTGIQLNNMLGEFDLAGNEQPGQRLRSMMTPALALDGDRARLVLGSAGSLRLRGAILQAAVNVAGHGLGVEDAIDRPRVHWEDPVVHCEGSTDASAMDELEAMGYDVTRWRRRNLYFGGVAAVEKRPDGTLHAAGDSRRGGHGIVVE